MIKLIIFDLWNTLAFSPRAKEFMAGLGIEKDKEGKKKYEENLMNCCFESDEELFRKLCDVFGIKFKDDIFQEFIRIFTDEVELYPDVIPVLEKLKQKYKLALVSNTLQTSVRTEQIDRLKALFDKVYYSCDECMLKPCPEIYLKVLKDFDVEPEESVMIGDYYADDIDAPAKLGIKGILLDRRKRYPDFEGEKIESLEELEVKL